jgi:hypothetical protein
LNKPPGARYAEQRHLPEGRRDPLQPIVYYSSEQQQKAQVFVDENGQFAFANGRLADGDWIFVVDQSGRMIASRADDGRVHHSSLSGGEPVMMAGELKISGGKLSVITNKSGHFRPDADAFKQFLGDLERQKVTLQGVKAPSFRGFTQTEANGNVLNDGTLGVPGRPMLSSLQAPPGANTGAAPVAHPVPELKDAPSVAVPVVQPPRPSGAGGRRNVAPRPSTNPRPATSPAEEDNYQSQGTPSQSPANGTNPPTTRWWAPAPAEIAWQLPLAA